MIESLLSMLQSATSWLWGGAVNTISMPWRGSLAVVFAAYAFRPLIRRGAPWLTIGILWLARGVCWATPRLLLLIEGVMSNLLEKAGIRPTRLQAFFSDTAVRAFAGLDSRSRSLIDKMRSSGKPLRGSYIRVNGKIVSTDKTRSSVKTRSPFRLRWVILAAALVPVIFYSTLSSRKYLDVVPPGLAWWHSFEHFLLSGAFPPSRKHDRHTLRVKDECLTDVNCLLHEALKTGKATDAELRLDNPDKFPSRASIWLLGRLRADWIERSQQSGLLRELLPSPTPTPMPDPTLIPTDGSSSPPPLSSRPKATRTPVTILIPARGNT